MADLVSDIKSRLSVYELVSQYVQLKKAGRNWKGLSPFKPEKTPSFIVSDEKQIWHCFSTGKGGDIFTFIQEYEGVEFSEALKILADKAGMKLEDYKTSFNPKTKSEKDEMMRAHELASDFFYKELLSTEDGKKVLKYLEGRGVSMKTIEEFKIGFAPDKYDALYPYLLKKGIRKSVLVKTGLCSTKNTDSERIYDKFRSRLMFPITDALGRICGFGGRALKKDQVPKYLNSPESLIYNKSKILFGLSFAKKHIKAEDKILLVEGYFDVILPYQEGISYVVATSGTALTKEQVNMIKRYTTNVFTCFDADSAGFNATVRSYELLKAQDMNIKTVDAKGGKDPADFVLADKEAFEKSVLDAKKFLEFYLDKLTEGQDLNDIDVRKSVIDKFLPFIGLLSPIEKDYYLRFASFKLNISEKLLYEELSISKNKFSARDQRGEKEQGFVLDSLDFEDFVLAFLLAFPSCFSDFHEKGFENFFKSDLKVVYNAMYKQYNASRMDEFEWDLDDEDFVDLKKILTKLILFAEDKYKDFDERLIKDEFEKIVRQVSLRFREREKNGLEQQIKEAEKSGDTKKLLSLLKYQQEILSKNS